jgi:PAS domain S-box-containing protein
LRALIENTPDFVMEVDRTGMVILANRFPDQIVGSDVRGFVIQGDVLDVNKTMQKSFEDGEKASMEIQTRDLDGRIAWNSVRIGPIMHDGKVTSLTVFVSNITERKQAEAEREKLVAELERRNAELERYTYTLSHELKTPIVTIRGFLGFVEDSIRKGNLERAYSDFARIGKAADRMYLMINELLELSRIGRVINPPEDIPFEEVALAGLSTSEPTLEAGNIKVHVQPNMPTVHVDLTRMIEVITNLVENAVKYMGAQPEPQIKIGMRDSASTTEWTFFVSDNGMGIDPAYHERVFRLFDKLDLQTPGTGIGLALVKRIIEAHGGEVWVESDGLGCGSTFCFTLPREKTP